MELDEMKKSDIISELQTLGVSVNPGKKREDLLAILVDKRAAPNDGGPQPSPIPATPAIKPPEQQREPEKKDMSDTERILAAIGGVASRVDKMEARVNRIETGGKDDFKMEAMPEDVKTASAGKEGIDPRIVKIVENTLGIDFGIEVKGNPDRPGFEFTVLVPRRLSNVATQFRPMRDEVTGAYKVDEKTKRVLEEEFWPGDRRSMQMGSTASYEMIQERCNRIRAFILSWYQKSNRPQPEFKLN